MFSTLADTYELVNHVLTLGFDVVWRRKLARMAGGGMRWLDVCSGTGETAIYLNRRARDGTRVFGVDFCVPMVRKASSKPEADGISFSIADATSLPFGDETFDLVTISFATRNLDVHRDALLESLREFRRVLVSGGRFLNLETSQPRSRLVRAFFHKYVRLFVKPVGELISGSKAGYAYLSHTIPRFYTAPQLGEIIEEAGFARVSFKPMLCGIVAIHEAVK